ncbi:hypothetical protein NA78x_002096 [Anatilimnocola sp. NA78]|uniref:hypothetical protein n=1 Tax=Anatilimnocola sp. NA78 TaxID=3415683 RepID=UPI003CE463B1
MPDETPVDIRTAAHALIASLPSGASWDDLMHRIQVRKCIESGLDDAKAKMVTDGDEVRRRFGLTS